jgi:predicted nucleotidyltransferase
MASNFLEILSQLHDHHVDFVIVGGVAASLHGGSRVTFDLDVVPSLTPDSWRAAIDLLWSVGARPRIPEPLERSALNFRTPDDGTEVDLVVGESDSFEQLRRRAVRVTVDHRTFFVASIEDLIAMKKRAGRPQDALTWLALAHDLPIHEDHGGPAGDAAGINALHDPDFVAGTPSRGIWKPRHEMESVPRQPRPDDLDDRPRRPQPKGRLAVELLRNRARYLTDLDGPARERLSA